MTVSWVLYLLQFVVLIGLLVVAVVVMRRTKTVSPPSMIIDEPPRPKGVLLTPPPTPKDRNEFLQTRIAYVAHMRDIGIEVEEEDESGNKKKIVRPAKPEEMIEAINIRDTDHVARLLETWDAVQEKQRKP